MGLTLITPGEGYILSLADAKRHCQITFNGDDDYITDLIAAVHAAIESDLCKVLMPQVWEETIEPGLYDGVGRVLSLCPVISIDSVLDVDDLDVQYDSKIPRTQPATLWPITDTYWPSPLVVVQYTVGFSEIPADIVHAARLWLATNYETRENDTERELKSMPLGVDRLLSRHRTVYI